MDKSPASPSVSRPSAFLSCVTLEGNFLFCTIMTMQHKYSISYLWKYITAPYLICGSQRTPPIILPTSHKSPLPLSFSEDIQIAHLDPLYPLYPQVTRSLQHLGASHDGTGFSYISILLIVLWKILVDDAAHGL